MAADKGQVGDEDTIRNLAHQTKEYAKEVYNANDDELDDIINGAKYDFDEFRTQLGDDINNAVDNFMSFFETNKR